MKKSQFIYVGHVISTGGFGLFILLFLIPAIIPPHNFVYDYNSLNEAIWEIPLLLGIFIICLISTFLHRKQLRNVIYYE